MDGEGLTLEDVQTEAAARQRAYESQQAKASTSGSGTEKGTIIQFSSVYLSLAIHTYLHLY